MATTNYDLEKRLIQQHPHTANALTKLISAMAGVHNKRGKRSIFGVDKRLKAYEKFDARLRDLLLCMVLDGLIKRNTRDDDSRRAVVDTIQRAMDIWPNWPDAYSFAAEFFVESADEANDRIGQLMRAAP